MENQILTKETFNKDTFIEHSTMLANVHNHKALFLKQVNCGAIKPFFLISNITDYYNPEILFEKNISINFDKDSIYWKTSEISIFLHNANEHTESFKSPSHK